MRLVWASIFGYLVFSEVPTIWSWTGGLLIFGAARLLFFGRLLPGRRPEQNVANEENEPGDNIDYECDDRQGCGEHELSNETKQNFHLPISRCVRCSAFLSPLTHCAQCEFSL